MGLKETQYNQIMKHYDLVRTLNHREEVRREEEIYALIPGFQDLNRKTAAVSVGTFRKRMQGKDISLDGLRQDLADIRREKERLLVEYGYPSDYLDSIYSCPDCKDTGYIDNEPCHCFNDLAEGFLEEQSNLRTLLKTENFEHLSYSYYTGQELDRFRKAVETSKAFVDDFSSDYRNLLFMGTVGTGKTFLSCCIAGELLKKGHSVMYYIASAFFDEVAEKTFSKKDREDGVPSDVFPKCDLLILDDLGSEMHNQFTSTKLFDLLNERYLKKLPMIISTNLNLRELEQHYSDRIFSRIFSNFTTMELSGNDIRIQKLTEKRKA